MPAAQAKTAPRCEHRKKRKKKDGAMGENRARSTLAFKFGEFPFFISCFLFPEAKTSTASRGADA